ncbi:hypothetical protein [Mucilaginibacter sp. SG564]|uniref:hypothetical protein n=1 Tax=unclassified Mucilaginibacter TaxID=2617802 RepID=UPI001551C14C|nr:hypothetical protein [Mucilaginibacter sp. SG564]NOW95617.1 hypothetical protein [Mucilaginibacter sp. SG564]
MKGAIFKSIFNNHLKQQLHTDKWQYKSSLVYSEITSGILKGFCFDSSAYGNDIFDLTAFVCPLYVPKSYLGLSFGDTLRPPNKRQRWDYDAAQVEQLSQQLAAVMNQAEKKFLSRINNAADFYKYYRWDKKNTFRYFEAVAYSLAYSGSKRADKELKNLLAYIRKNEDLSGQHVSQTYNNTERLLWSDDRKAVLDEWEQYTRTELKI